MGIPDTKAEGVKAIRNGRGIQVLLQEGYTLLGNPVYLQDLDYKLLGCTQDINTDDPLWNEIVETGGHSAESIELLKNEYFIDAVANAETIALLESDKLNCSRILGKIFNREHILVGFACVVACQKPFTEDTAAVFEAFCKKLSREVGKSEFYQVYGETQQETLLQMLIDGQIQDKRLYTHRVAELYRGLKETLYLGLVDTGLDVERLAHMKKTCRQAQPAFQYAIYDRYIVVLLSDRHATLHSKKALGKLYTVLEQNQCRMGISSGFENLFQLPVYYREALHALNSGTAGEAGQWLLHKE